MSETDFAFESSAANLDIAIIGMTGRFPGARNLGEFWANLRAGTESIAFFDDSEVEAAGVDPTLLRDPRYVKAGGALADVELFDAGFFGFYPKEAAVMDPQHRIFLECAWEAIEHAGYDTERFAGPIGVYAGLGLNTYLLHNLISNRAATAEIGDYQMMLGNDKDFLPTRVSYKLNLRGPSINVQTACSTSLVAVHLACQSLLNYQCDMALAGGVAVRLPQTQGYLYTEGGIASPDGHCRAFDANAQGTVPGNGVGIVVLKRLADAQADGDTIYAVIKGSAINNDGALKVGYTAPSVDGQAEVIATAQALAGVTPDSISYIEAHGTGTPIGDPIEIAALNQVFGDTAAPGSVAIGAVKSNIGHLDAAAGVAGLIKTTLALMHQELPPSLHFQHANPATDMANTAFYVNNKLSDWRRSATPRRAGVSSFGIGGTNAHLIVEEAPLPEPTSASRPWQLLLLSAKTPTALHAAATNLAAHLRAQPDDLADVGYTLQLGRQQFNQRAILVARTAAEAAATLESFDPQQLLTGQAAHERPVAFLFTGQGAQYPQMAAGLYQNEPLFREVIDHCAEVLRPHLGLDLRAVLFGADKDGGRGTEDSGRKTADQAQETRGDTAVQPQYVAAQPTNTQSPIPNPQNGGHSSLVVGQELNQTQYTQPALFAVEYALAQLWMSWGVQPQAMIGHSIGEYVAACLAGVFSLEDALALVAQRGKLMQALPGGAMLSVPLSEARLRPLLNDELALAAVNAPELCVVAGPHTAIEALAERLAADGINARILHTSHAFHSAMMDPILEPFRRAVGQISLNPPQIPFVSNLSGNWISDEQATSPAYWANHLRQAVRFGDGLSTLLADQSLLLLEVGPGQTLSTFARRHPEGAGRSILASLRHPQEHHDDQAFILTTLGRLWLAGVKVDWPALWAGERRRRVALPTYPFERQRYWIEAGNALQPAQVTTTSLSKDPAIANWFYAPSWQRANVPLAIPAIKSTSSNGHHNGNSHHNGNGQQNGNGHSTPATAGLAHEVVLLLAHEGKLAQLVAQQLYAQGASVITVRPGARYGRPDQSSYTINPRERGDYDALLADLRALGKAPTAVLHAWGLAPHDTSADEAQALGALSLITLAQALGQHHGDQPLRLLVATSGTQDVTGDETLYPERATILGASRVLPQEFPQLLCRTVDLPLPAPGSQAAARSAAWLVAELSAPASDLAVAYRGNHRWVQQFVALPATTAHTPRLRERGVYLITGGLGNIGLTLAETLAQGVQARLVLVGRQAPDAAQRERLAQLEALGAEVLTLSADVANVEQLRLVVARAESRFGAIHGVIHAAGFVGEAALRAAREISASDYAQHMQAKLHGTLALAEALRGIELDFVLLQSSLSTVLGGLGMAAYAAANAFLDTFAAQQRQAGLPWQSLNWDGWKFAANEARLVAIGGKLAELAITPAEGASAFQHALEFEGYAQLVISTGNLALRIERALGRGVSEPAPETADAGALYARPTSAGSYVAPRSALEQELADEWQRVLGIGQIGAHDNFFELGGHSLLATQLVARLRERYSVELPLRNLFESPTVAGLAALIASQRDTSEAQPVEAGIVPVRDTTTPVLSFGQQRLWFLDQLEPGSPLYNNPAAVRLTGQLDPAVLERSLNEIVRRHAVLRTSFAAEDGKPVPVVAENAQIAIPLRDLRNIPPVEREVEVLRLAYEEAQRPFDLARGPLLRLTLLRVAADEHIALLTMQHIVSDGWSTMVFIRELVALYDAFQRGMASPLPELRVQYADYAAWQRRWLTAERLESQLDYWRKQLGGELTTLELPTDLPRPASQTFNGATRWLSIPRELTVALERLSQQEGVTLFMTLLAAFQTLLHRYSGQDDILVGTPIAGRTRAETEELIGFFVNTLVMRTDFSGAPNFRELLARVRELALGAYAHQDVPFESLVDAVQPQRDLSRTPLFQVMFVLQDAQLPSLELPGLSVRPLEVDTGTAKFDLTLYLEQGPDGLRGWLNYNTDLFYASTIERLQEHLLVLLNAIAEDPNQAVGTLPLLSLAERWKLLVEWNSSTPAPASDPTGIVAMFEAQVARTPYAIAVDCEGVTLSYAELNRRANQVAHALRNRGVAPEMLVGVAIERSVEAIVALLGVLKSGGAYLPLDPAYPAERLAFLLEDARPVVVLTDREIADFRLQIVDWEGQICNLHSAIYNLSGDNPTAITRPEHLAYVIYTSGSTGKPKGVMIEHGTFAAHSRDCVQFYELTPADGVLCFASLNFDAALEQIVPTLLAGAKLVLRGPEVWPTDTFHLKVAQHGLTVINPPTAYWHQLAQEWAAHPEHAPADTLRLVIAGGDAIRPEVVQLWQRSPLAHVRLLNAYGPTETTITATTYQVPRLRGSAALRRLPIGRPLPNRSSYILDRNGKPAPIGVPGELYIGGQGVARGYLGRPELTNERFVADPFSTVPGARLYKTGDLARYLPDGNIEFLGRADNQVKIRGFRIELGEIETLLGQHPAVRQAVVIAREDQPGDRRVVAYVVPAVDGGRWTVDGGQPSGDETTATVVRLSSSVAADLRTHLAAALPEYMLPQAFVLLEALPLTPSGKLDRRALPAPDTTSQVQTPYVAPRTALEEELAQVWAEVLGVERVGIEDSFFDLGGHSLLATQLVSRLRATFQTELPLRRLFETPTIAGVSLLLAESQAAQTDDDELAQLLAELEGLSDDEAQGLLEQELGS